ncbi:MAG: MarR family transcriptional regulator [Deltaproteobacteria bacterium]|nr:MarR family transcriptional regulator [Deltaproteobacteria bacterium]
MQIQKNFGFLINKTGLKIKLKIQRMFADNGYPITTEHWGILQCLYESDGLSQVELSSILEKDKPNITRILDVMEKNDLVVRRSDPGDRRKFLIFLTDKSMDIKDDLFRLSIKCREDITVGIPDSELKLFISMLNKMSKNME